VWTVDTGILSSAIQSRDSRLEDHSSSLLTAHMVIVVF
jgi:hypothetical protein